MKAKEWFAKDFASRWSKPAPSTSAQDALAHAYLMGFTKMQDHAVGLLKQLGGRNNLHLAVLMRGICTAEVDEETGKSLTLEEDTP